LILNSEANASLCDDIPMIGGPDIEDLENTRMNNDSSSENHINNINNQNLN